MAHALLTFADFVWGSADSSAPLTWLLSISAARADTLKAVPFSHLHGRQCSFRVAGTAVNCPPQLGRRATANQPKSAAPTLEIMRSSP